MLSRIFKMILLWFSLAFFFIVYSGICHYIQGPHSNFDMGGGGGGGVTEDTFSY